MEPSAFCLLGFFMAFVLLQVTVITQAMSLDIQINIKVPDTGGVLVEGTSESLIPPAEMIWRDSKENIIPHSTFDSQDRAGLLYLKSSILLKNRTQSPITCSIYNFNTNQEKKRSIVIPDVLFKPEYMSLISNKFLCPIVYLSIIVFIIILRGIFAFFLLKGKPVYIEEVVIKIQKVLNRKMRDGCKLIWEYLSLVLYIVFLPIYLNFRSQDSNLEDAYSLYSHWLYEICTILIVTMIFFTGLTFILLWKLNCSDQMSCLPSTSNSEQNSSESAKF